MEPLVVEFRHRITIEPGEPYVRDVAAQVRQAVRRGRHKTATRAPCVRKQRRKQSR